MYILKYQITIIVPFSSKFSPYESSLELELDEISPSSYFSALNFSRSSTSLIVASYTELFFRFFMLIFFDLVLSENKQLRLVKESQNNDFTCS